MPLAMSDEKRAELEARSDVLGAKIDSYWQSLGVKDYRVAMGACGSGPVVYFVSYEDGQKVKIGTSRKFPERLAQLRYYCPEPLTVEALLPGSFDLEQYIHCGFAEDRLHGEWFQRSEYLAEYIAWVRETFGEPEVLVT